MFFFLFIKQETHNAVIQTGQTMAFLAWEVQGAALAQFISSYQGLITAFGSETCQIQYINGAAAARPNFHRAHRGQK